MQNIKRHIWQLQTSQTPLVPTIPLDIRLQLLILINLIDQTLLDQTIPEKP